MTELEELRLRVSRAKRLIAEIRDEVLRCRKDVKDGLTEDADNGLVRLIEMLDDIDSALGGE